MVLTAGSPDALLPSFCSRPALQSFISNLLVICQRQVQRLNARDANPFNKLSLFANSRTGTLWGTTYPRDLLDSPTFGQLVECDTASPRLTTAVARRAYSQRLTEPVGGTF